MRQLIVFVGSVLVLLLVVWLRRSADNFRFVVPPRAGDVLYATTFDGGILSEDWSIEVRRGGAIEIADGALHLQFDEIVPGENLLRSNNQYLFGDFDMRVTSAATGGTMNNSFGVIFRQIDPQTYYLFYISSDGWYSVWRETPDERFALSNWIPSDAIVQGVTGERNVLRVVAEGDTFRFFVNDEHLLLCVPDDRGGQSTYTNECVGGTMQDSLTDTTIPYGQVGVAIETIVDGGMAVTFDDVVLVPAD